MTRIVALLAVVLAVAVNAAEQSKSANLIMPVATEYQAAEKELTTSYRATLDTIHDLYSELGMDEEMNEASSYRSQPDKARATLQLALRRLAGEELTIDEVNEAYSNSYRLNIGALVNAGNLQYVLELTSQFMDVQEQLGTAVTALKEMKGTVVGLGMNAMTMARVGGESIKQVKTLANKVSKIYKVVMADKGVAPLLKRLMGMMKSNKPAAPVDVTEPAAAPAVDETAPAVPEVAAAVPAVPAMKPTVAEPTPVATDVMTTGLPIAAP